MQLDHRAYQQHLRRLQRQPRTVSGCLPYEDMMEVPEAFDFWATTDARELHPGNGWADLCPVYALALATHAAYWPQLDTAALLEVEAQWDELRGVSSLSWDEALPVLARAWRALDRINHKPSLPAGDFHG